MPPENWTRVGPFDLVEGETLRLDLRATVQPISPDPPR